MCGDLHFYCQRSGNQRLLLAIDKSLVLILIFLFLNFADCWSLPCFIWRGESHFCSHSTCADNYEKWAWKDNLGQDFWRERHIEWEDCGMTFCSHLSYLFFFIYQGNCCREQHLQVIISNKSNGQCSYVNCNTMVCTSSIYQQILVLISSIFC